MERHWKRRWGALIGLAVVFGVMGCDRGVHEGERDGTAISVVPAERSSTAAPLPSAGLRERLQRSLEGELQEEEELAESLDALSAADLWSVLSWLPSAEGDSGKRVGLAAVVLSKLVEKAPSEAAAYLTTDGAPYSLTESSVSLMAFRRAMTQWVASEPEEAFEALETYQASSDIRARILELQELHGERLEVTLAGAMPVSNLDALTERWDRLEHREAASLLPRLLERLPSPEERESLMDRTAAWLGEQWSSEGPGVVFEWALGLPDDALQKAILSRVKEPQRGPDGS